MELKITTLLVALLGTLSFISIAKAENSIWNNLKTEHLDKVETISPNTVNEDQLSIELQEKQVSRNSNTH